MRPLRDFRRIAAGLLAASVVAAGFASVGLSVASASPTQILSVNFDDGTMGTLVKSGNPTLSVVDGGVNGKALNVADRVNSWDTVQTATGLFAAGITYTLTAQVKLDASVTGTSQAHFTVDDGSYAWVGTKTISASGWTTVTGNYTLPNGANPSTVKTSLEVGAASSGEALPGFLIDDIVFTANDPVETTEPTEPLPDPGTVVLNTDFESGLDGWVARNASSGNHTVAITTTDAHSGSQSALVSNRTSQGSGIGHDTTGLLVAGATYDVTAWVRFAPGAPMDAIWLTHQRTTAGSDDFKTLGQYTNVTNDGWNQIKASFTMTSAETSMLYFETRYTATGGNVSDFLVDDIKVVVATPPPPATEDPDVPFAPAVYPTVKSDFETSLDPWQGRGASIALTDTDAHTGDSSLEVTGRTAGWNGAALDPAGLLTAGTTYTFSVWVRLADPAAGPVLMNLGAQEPGAANEFPRIGEQLAVSGDWVLLMGTYTPTSEHPPTLLYIEAADPTVDFLVDDAVIGVPRPGPVPSADGAYASGEYRDMFTEWDPSLTEADIQAKLDQYWTSFFTGTDDTKRIYYPDGSNENGPKAYILDTGNSDIRSEGMSYGMMIAVQMDKQAEFDAMWNWAVSVMQVKSGAREGYFCWQALPNNTCADQNNAPDGEEYMTMALFFAAHRWGNGTGIYNYEAQANKILDLMLHKEDINGGVVDGITNMFNHDQKMVVFVPEGNSAKFSDPSYHLPAFYELWGRWAEGWNGNQEADRQFWLDAADRSREYFVQSTNPSTGLAPDYAEFDGSPNTTGNHADFRFDAWRTAVNWSVDNAWWAKDDTETVLSNRIQSFFERKGIDTYANQYTLIGTGLSTDHSPGLVANNAVASLAATDSRAWKFVEELWKLQPSTGQYRYYDGLLNFMGLLHVSGNFKIYGPQDEPTPTPTPSESVTATPTPTVSTSSPAPSDSGTPSQTTPTIPTLNDSNRGSVSVPETAVPGQTIQVTVGTAHAGKTVSVWLHSDPVLLVTGVVSSTGTISATIPADTILGDHTIIVFDDLGQLIGWDNVRIIAGVLATTGRDLGALPIVAIFVAALGALILIRRRRFTA